MCFMNNIFYLKIFLKLQINITQHLYHFYRFIIFWRGGENNIYIQKKTMLILDMFIYKNFNEKIK